MPLVTIVVLLWIKWEESCDPFSVRLCALPHQSQRGARPGSAVYRFLFVSQISCVHFQWIQDLFLLKTIFEYLFAPKRCSLCVASEEIELAL